MILEDLLRVGIEDHFPDIAFPYGDDLIIHSDSIALHLDHLARILFLLRAQNWSADLGSSDFAINIQTLDPSLLSYKLGLTSDHQSVGQQQRTLQALFADVSPPIPSPGTDTLPATWNRITNLEKNPNFITSASAQRIFVIILTVGRKDYRALLCQQGLTDHTLSSVALIGRTFLDPLNQPGASALYLQHRALNEVLTKWRHFVRTGQPLHVFVSCTVPYPPDTVPNNTTDPFHDTYQSFGVESPEEPTVWLARRNSHRLLIRAIPE
jgi:hypothetical protein